MLLDQLVRLVKDNAGEGIIRNPVIPDKQNLPAIETVANSILDTLKSLATGGMDQLFNLFNKPDPPAVHQVTEMASSSASQNLMQRFGISAPQAQDIVGKVIPDVMGKLIHKTNDPQDPSFDLQSIAQAVGVKAPDMPTPPSATGVPNKTVPTASKGVQIDKKE